MKAERSTPLEFRQEGRRLVGPAVVYGDVSPSHRERFTAGTFGNLDDGETRWLNLEHRQNEAIAWTGGGLTLTDTKDALLVRAEIPQIPAGEKALADVRSGRLTGFSVEFRAHEEHRDSGLRVITGAALEGIGLVRMPSYQQSVAEVRGRGGRTLSSVIPADTDVECACVGGGCEFIRITQDLMAEMWDRTFTKFERQAVATYSDYRTALASTSRGTMRGRIDENGDGVVDIDIPTGAAGDAVIAAHDAAGVVVRPFIDSTTATGRTVVREDGTSVFEYDHAELRAVIISATDARKGWPEPRIVPTPDELMDGERSALVTPAWKRRAAIWL